MHFIKIVYEAKSHSDAIQLFFYIKKFVFYTGNTYNMTCYVSS